MKRNLISRSLGLLIPCLLFSVLSCNYKDETAQKPDLVIANDLSESIDMGGQLMKFSEVSDLIENNKKHAAIVGDDYIKYEVFDKDLIEEIMKSPDCQAIRVYYGYSLPEKKKQLMIVGVDKYGNNIIKSGSMNDKVVGLRGTASNDFEDPIQKKVPLKISALSETVNMGGQMQRFYDGLDLIENNKRHTDQIGDDYTKWETFDKDVIKAILSQADCQAIKIFYGYSIAKKQKRLVIVGADRGGNNVVKSFTLKEIMAAVEGIGCPPLTGCI